MLKFQYAQIFLGILVALHCLIAIPINLECKFGYHNFSAVGSKYTCFVQNDLSVLQSDVKIDKILGNRNQSPDSVTAIIIENKTTEYLPSNLGEKFKNLIALEVNNGRLKEIHQNDLKELRNLRYLNLNDNDIEALDYDLFEFNPKLEIIQFSKNKIKSIGRTVFGNLSDIKELDLQDNECSQKIAVDDKVAEVVDLISNECFKPETELNILKQNHQNLKNDNVKLAGGADLLRIKNIKLVKDFEALSKKISQKDLEIENLKSENKELKDKIPKKEELQKMDENREKDLETQKPLKETVKCENQIAEKVKLVNEMIEKDVKDLKNKTNQLENELEEERSSLKKLSKEKSNLQQELENIKKEKHQLEGQLVRKSNETLAKKEKISKELESVKNDKISLENQLNSSITESQNMQKNFTDIINLSHYKNIQLETQLKDSALDSEKIQKNLTKNVKHLEKTNDLLKNKNLQLVKINKGFKTSKEQLEEQKLNLEQRLQKEETKLHDLNTTNNKNLVQLEDCKINNGELKKQLENINSNYQIIQKKLSDEVIRGQNKRTQFEDLFALTKQKFDGVQMNLTLRFENLQNRTSEILNKQSNLKPEDVQLNNHV